MIVVDNALRARAEAGRPIRVGILGSGFMAQGLSNTIVNDIPGMRLSAIYGRKPERAVKIFEYPAKPGAPVITAPGKFEDSLRAGKPTVSEDAFLLAQSEHIDVLVDTTGSVEFGAR